MLKVIPGLFIEIQSTVNFGGVGNAVEQPHDFKIATVNFASSLSLFNANRTTGEIE
jgi:hypothetical protein